MKKIIFSLLLIYLISFSCKKENSKPIFSNQECFNLKKDSNYLTSNIIGSWQWVTEYTINQITGEKIYKTPQSEGYSKSVVFSSSSKCFFYTNSIVINEYNYKITRMFEYTQYQLDSNFVLGFHSSINNSYISFSYLRPCNDTLILNPNRDYSPIQTFIRN